MTRNLSNQNPKSVLKPKTGNYLSYKKSKIQREHMVNLVSSSLPKGGHSATQTELQIIETHIR